MFRDRGTNGISNRGCNEGFYHMSICEHIYHNIGRRRLQKEKNLNNNKKVGGKTNGLEEILSLLIPRCQRCRLPRRHAGLSLSGQR
jgi:hypothetical protein